MRTVSSTANSEALRTVRVISGRPIAAAADAVGLTRRELLRLLAQAPTRGRCARICAEASTSRTFNTAARAAAAASPLCPPATLLKVSTDPSPTVRDSVRCIPGRSPTASNATRRTLAVSVTDATTSDGAVDNRGCPPAMLAALAGDPHRHIRFGVAINPATPPELLWMLPRDDDAMPSLGVALNPNCPEPLLELLGARSSNYFQR